MKQKWKIYVGVERGGKLKFVTKDDPQTKFCYWNDGEPAEVFETMDYAKSVVIGLLINGYCAMVIQLPEAVEVSNKEEK